MIQELLVESEKGSNFENSQHQEYCKDLSDSNFS